VAQEQRVGIVTVHFPSADMESDGTQWSEMNKETKKGYF